ncbi:hypothetical protein RJ640_014330 [Escallonia rubra]|uniref:Homeobox domain-containing protein n=1 Tax=Escallonia rubra TaxID=112253 RepID=A0AA88UEJ4_9ASTE|nr:hypothetical protein RJ640_014330 [Escallonia rubra]
MADEGFEAYHVPQQSRRDKLREIIQSHPHPQQLQGCAGLLPLYDPSLLSSYGGVKEEGSVSFLGGGYLGIINSNSNNGCSNSSSSSYMDPPHLNHLDHVNNNSSINPYFYTQNLDHHQSFHNGGGSSDEVVAYKPEPLSINMTHHEGLSLSLSNSQQVHHNNLPLELNLQRYGGLGSGGTGGNDLFRSVGPLGPFTGYASILKGSRFLKPAQQLLEELCDLGCGGNGYSYTQKIVTAESSALMMDPPSLERVVDDPQSCGEGGEHGRKKSRLITMLDEVYRRYKQYYQQMQAVVASFESVAGLSNAAPFATLALKAMSKHFRCLKNTITDQLQFATKSHGHISFGKDEMARSENSDRSLYTQRPLHNLGYIEQQPVWRPQRGLPERAVTVLRAWLFEHFLHPYPTDTDKLMLAKQTGLSRNQVSNWFINARVRLWKPMVEEIHTLETRQVQKASQRDDQSADRPNDPLPAASSLACENSSTSTERIQDLPSKRTRNNFSINPIGNIEPLNLLYDNSSRHPHVGIEMSSVGGSSVSLTLGLHQNNGIGLPEPFPMNAARRFGIDSSSEGFVMGSFGAQSRQFGRDIIGGQLLHDFVG